MPLAPNLMARPMACFIARRKRDAALQLRGDALGHELGVLVGLLDLNDIDEDRSLSVSASC